MIATMRGAIILSSMLLIGHAFDTSYQPPPLLSPFGSYPNPLRITDADRSRFHPVVIFPTIEQEGSTVSVPNIQLLDFTVPPTSRQLATEQERTDGIRPAEAVQWNGYAVGRFDEDRVGIYESTLFDDTSNAIDGFAGRRTVHVGMDLDGPVGTPVYAFCDGSVVHSGYNAPLGDYGHVLVIEHTLPEASTTDAATADTEPRKIYALYGHLSAPLQYKQGDTIKQGEVVGHMGDFMHSGGWFIPHVHFQLSMHCPETHDMPGVVAVDDRAAALQEYIDPRYIVGPLY